MSAKSVIGVVIVAILIGVLYVVFEKNFSGSKTLSNTQSSSAQELSKESPGEVTKQGSSLINLPTPAPSAAPLTDSSDLASEAQSLEMRDYSGLFEELKETVAKN